MAKNAERPAAAAEAAVRQEVEQTRETPETVSGREVPRFGAHRYEVADGTAELIGRGERDYVQMKADREKIGAAEDLLKSGALERQIPKGKGRDEAIATLREMAPHIQGARDHIAAKSEVYRSVGLNPDRELSGGKLSWRERRRFAKAEKRAQDYEKSRDNRNVLLERFAEGADGLGRREYKKLKKALLKADDRLTRSGERLTGRIAQPATEYEMKEYAPDQQAADLQERLQADYVLPEREGPWAQRKQAKRRETMERAVGGVLRLENRGQELNRASEHAKGEGNVKELIWAHESRQGNGQELSRARNQAGNSYERAKRAGKVYEMIHVLRERGADAAKAGIGAAKEAWAKKAETAEAAADGKSATLAAEAEQTQSAANGDVDRLSRLEGRVDILEAGQAELKTKLQAEIDRVAAENHLNPEDKKTLEAAVAAVVKGRQEAAVAKREQAAVAGGTPDKERQTAGGGPRPGEKAHSEAAAGADRERGETDEQRKLLTEITKYQNNIVRDLRGRLQELPLDQLRLVAKAARPDAELRASQSGSENSFSLTKFEDFTGHSWKREEYGINTFIEECLSKRKVNQPATETPVA